MKIRIIFISVTLALIGLGLGLYFGLPVSHPQAVKLDNPVVFPAQSAQAVQYLSQPPTVSQIASSLADSKITDCGPAPLAGVTDSAVADLPTIKIGIDTFPAQAQRDNWKTLSADFGIIPFAEGPTWVAYKATDQKQGC